MVAMTTQMFEKIIEMTGKTEKQFFQEINQNFSEQYIMSSSEIGDIDQMIHAKESMTKSIIIK